MTSGSKQPATLVAMVRGLAQLSILGFGGVGPQAYHFFVERSAWLDADEFAEFAGIAQALPGANVVNLCAIVGDRWFGPIGALAAVSAMTLPSLVVILVAASVLAHVTRAPRFVGAECALVAASAGLILATAARVFSTIVRRRAIAIGIAGGVVVTVGTHLATMPLATIVGVAAGFTVDFCLRARP